VLHCFVVPAQYSRTFANWPQCLISKACMLFCFYHSLPALSVCHFRQLRCHGNFYHSCHAIQKAAADQHREHWAEHHAASRHKHQSGHCHPDCCLWKRHWHAAHCSSASVGPAVIPLRTAWACCNPHVHSLGLLSSPCTQPGLLSSPCTQPGPAVIPMHTAWICCCCALMPRLSHVARCCPPGHPCHHWADPDCCVHFAQTVHL